MITITDGELHHLLRHQSHLQLVGVCPDPPDVMPGALTLPSGTDLRQALDAARPTVVYGCGPRCDTASRAVEDLCAAGFTDVRLLAHDPVHPMSTQGSPT